MDHQAQVLPRRGGLRPGDRVLSICLPSRGIAVSQVSREQAFTDGYAALGMAWASVMGTTIQEPIASILAGQVWGESLFGRAVAGTRPLEWGSNNYGNIQATPGWCAQHKADPGWGYILLGDVHADGTPYVYPYRLYPCPWYAALDYLQFVKARVDLLKVASPRDYATALKAARYYEAPLETYVAMVSGGQRLCLAALDLGLSSVDPTQPTGDDMPPDALDGKHLPGRVTIWTAVDPPEGAFGASTATV